LVALPFPFLKTGGDTKQSVFLGGRASMFGLFFIKGFYFSPETVPADPFSPHKKR
jgi:hypothetical protein